MKSLISSVEASNFPAVLSSCWIRIGIFHNGNTETYSLVLGPNACLPRHLSFLRTPLINSACGLYLGWSHLYLETSLKFSSAYSFLNFVRTSCRVVSRLRCDVCQNLMESSPRRLRKNCSFSSSVTLFWNGRMPFKTKCLNSLCFSYWLLKIGTWTCSSFILACVVCTRRGRSVTAAITWFSWSFESSSEAPSWSLECSRWSGVGAAEDLVLYRCWVGLSLNGHVLFCQSVWLSSTPVNMLERWPENLDRLDVMFPSVDLLELLSLSSLAEWLSASSCAAGGATIDFLILSTLLDDNFRSSIWDSKLSSASLLESAEMCASPISTNCRILVLFFFRYC